MNELLATSVPVVPAAATPPAPAASASGVRFTGIRSDFRHLITRGALLEFVTLGFYRFWLATDVRRHLWSHTEVGGDTAEYTGTAKELLIGFLFALAILVPIYLAYFFITLEAERWVAFASVPLFLFFYLFTQFAVYRARRYRLTRTVFRGIRFHQGGSPMRYAFYALFWWTFSALTLGLAYPWQIASLERYKMRNTFYGDLAGRFDGSGLRLFIRGLPMWFLVVAPLVVTVGAFVETVDWTALIDALSQGGDDTMGRLEGASPGLAGLIVFAMLMAGTSIAAVAILYPAFHAMVLRWWCSGLRFGEIEFHSRLATLSIYTAYGRFLGIALLFSLALGIAAFPALYVAGWLSGTEGSVRSELLGWAMFIIGYVVAALGYSTIYQATVKFSFWQLAMESLQLSRLEALERVKATGLPSSAVGEGLADALNVGGY